MFRLNLFLAFFLLTIGLHAKKADLSDLTEELVRPQCLKGDVFYKVYLPTSADPVVYDIVLTTSNTADALSPSDYLITWQLPRGKKVSRGFSSYADGNHFRCRDARLQEYHLPDDSLSFSSKGGGVQRNAQFADLLPAFLAEKLHEMQNDSTFFYDRTGNVVSGVQRVNGYDALEFTYEFDPVTKLPVKTEIVYNPAGIAEQTVSTSYSWEKLSDCPSFDEDYLITLFPEEFAKFRESNFRAENLKGTRIPPFSFLDKQGQRINHSRGESDLPYPAVIAFVDSKVFSTGNVIQAVEKAASDNPKRCEAIFAFAGNEIPENFAGNRVMRSDGLSRQCGVARYPTFIFLNSDGSVAEVLIGITDDLETVLEQTIMLLN